MLFSSSHTRPRYTHLSGSSDALALAQYARQNVPLVVIAASALEAQRLVDEIPFFSPELRVHLLPDWETLPYDHFSPHQDLISERLATLHHIRSQSCDVIVVPITTALYPLSPVEYLAAYTFFLKCGETLDIAKFREQMTLAGYTHVQQVLTPGEYCIRGGLIDLFPMGSSVPYRIDLFDDEIDAIATFDVDTQRTIYPVRDIRLLPAREFPLDEAGQARFRQNFRDRFEGDPSKSSIYKGVSRGIAPAGIEYYLPLFFERTATLFDYLPSHATLCMHHNVDAAIATFAKDAQLRYNLLRGDPQRPLLETHELFLNAESFFIAAKNFKRVDLIADTPSYSPIYNTEVNENGGETPLELFKEERSYKTLTLCATQKLPDIAVNRRADIPTHAFQSFLQDYTGRVLLLADSLGRREIMAEYLREYGLAPTLCEDYAQFLTGDNHFMLTVGALQNGLMLQDEQLAIITESELYYAAQPRSRIARATKKTNVEGMLRDLSELKPGDPVVHEQHGIARYHGLINLDLGEGENEFLLLEYAGGDKLYVPVAQLHVISRYSGGAPETAPMHKLGSGTWDKAKRRAMQQVRDTAAELLNLYAQRATRKGHQFKLSQHDYEAFAAGFGFEETPDQAAAIKAVVSDLQSGKPMDRLICGDVGFGKTEVALRAAFIAAMDGKQVAVLVPTTLLTEQHFQNFCNRFADWPIKIGELSRFRSAKEQTQTLKDMGDGKLDI
ncbi:MAG: CarD family transcriptional regulator, partial [Candidatus Nitrotoga sp.]